MVRQLAFLLGLFMLVATPLAVAAQETGKPMLLAVDPDPLIVETAAGERSFSVEVADTDAERSRGLMFRTMLPQDRGMLFVFERTRRVAFWMRNTPLPLDLVFIGEDGRVKAIMQGEPFSDAMIAPDAEIRFVLEVNAGTAQMAGIAGGDRVRHPRIDEVAGAD